MIKSNHKLELKMTKRIPVKFKFVKKLNKLQLKNETISNLVINLIEILPTFVYSRGKSIKLNCYQMTQNKLLFSYQNSKNLD